MAAGRLSAGQIVVFGEKDFHTLGPGAVTRAPADPDRAAFFRGYQEDRARGVPYESAVELTSPPAWGKTVGAATRGTLRFHPSFAGGFACQIALDNLLPDHDYILTLNGNPARAGNGLLLSAVPGIPKERYYDFLIVTTDALGHYDADLGVFLKAGSYDVRCYVKDTGDFKIVLYHDYFRFAVR
jgi:hypothetical protein